LITLLLAIGMPREAAKIEKINFYSGHKTRPYNDM